MPEERAKVMPYEPVELPADLIAELEALDEPFATKKTRWTDRQDAILLGYWEKKTKADVAKLVGLNESTCRTRYKYLQKQIAAGEQVKEYVE